MFNDRICEALRSKLRSILIIDIFLGSSLMAYEASLGELTLQCLKEVIAREPLVLVLSLLCLVLAVQNPMPL